ncbi:hypothetical protein [Haloglycomyces albus]|uniref:hypothetical protein n=1 Tax=Haloglycomyces albus TaxID=526067 RepID=UPI00046CBE37|nr:hypothetical protein [Haloglycomyces albus]
MWTTTVTRRGVLSSAFAALTASSSLVYSVSPVPAAVPPSTVRAVTAAGNVIYLLSQTSVGTVRVHTARRSLGRIEIRDETVVDFNDNVIVTDVSGSDSELWIAGFSWNKGEWHRSIDAPETLPAHWQRLAGEADPDAGESRRYRQWQSIPVLVRWRPGQPPSTISLGSFPLRQSYVVAAHHNGRGRAGVVVAGCLQGDTQTVTRVYQLATTDAGRSWRRRVIHKDPAEMRHVSSAADANGNHAIVVPTADGGSTVHLGRLGRTTTQRTYSHPERRSIGDELVLPSIDGGVSMVESTDPAIRLLPVNGWPRRYLTVSHDHLSVQEA